MGGAGRITGNTGRDPFALMAKQPIGDHVHEIWKVHTLKDKVVFSGVHVRVRRVSWAVLYAL